MQTERTWRVLIVDDEEEQRSLLKRGLSGEDLRCDTASDGVEAKRLSRMHKYDAVITDLKMPRMHGHQLAVGLLAEADPPLVFIVTGLAEPKLVGDLLKRGAADVFLKPVVLSLFVTKVRALLERQSDIRIEGGIGGGRSTNLAGNLKAQLAEVTSSFRETIAELERQQAQLEEGYVGSLRMLTSIMTAPGVETKSHAGRVEKLAQAIGERLKLEREPMRHLQMAALLHDVGQVGMPDDVRSKPPWMLTGDELKSFHRYPVVGAALLSEIRGAETIAAIVESHAENWNGSGFPNGLRGQEIPIEARILRIADGCDIHMMFAGKGEPEDELREHLHAERGVAYDPEIASLALSCLPSVYGENKGRKILTLSMDELRPLMVLAENLYDPHGHFLAREGATVTESMLDRLCSLLRGQKIRVFAP